MAILTADLVLKEGFRVLRNNCPFINSLSRSYDGTNEAAGAKAGDSIRIKTPMEYVTTLGAALGTPSSDEKSVTLVKAIQRHVPLSFTTADLSQEMVRFSELYVTPAIATLASVIDNDVLTQAFQGVYNTQAPVTDVVAKTVLDAGATLSEGSTPKDSMRCAIYDPRAEAGLVDNLKGLFQASDKIAAQYDDGAMGRGLGFYNKMSQNIPKFTTGNRDTAYVVGGTPPVDGETALDVVTGTGNWKVGDSFTIAGVNSVNALTKDDNGQLQNFVVTVASAGGSTTLQVLPEFISTGDYKNITALPAAAAVITPIGAANTSYSQNMAYHPQAFAFGTTDLELPGGLAFSARRTEDGISMRLIGQYDVSTDRVVYRFDVLYGIVTVQPRFAVRIPVGGV